MSEDPSLCPLCGAAANSTLESEGRVFQDCAQCGLIYVAREHLLSPSAERARYETHRNDPGDQGYRDFLDRLARPLIERLSAGAEGLDFGSGPGPTLSLMMSERGFPCQDWDPFFAPEDEMLARDWDFVSCTEVLEHLFDPSASLHIIDRMLRPGGWLGTMTTMYEDSIEFAEWWYARDPTHVAFYRERTFEWIAEAFSWELVLPAPNVALFRKSQD